MEAPVSSSTLDSEEKKVLRLAKRLREIVALEKLSAGETLQTNQREKVATKANIAADFLAVVGTLVSGSDVIAKVQDVVSAMTAADAEQHVVCQSATESSAAVESTVEASDGSGFGCEPVLEAAAEPEAPKNRWRGRGGRSGFRRKFERAHQGKERD